MEIGSQPVLRQGNAINFRMSLRVEAVLGVVISIIFRKASIIYVTSGILFKIFVTLSNLY